MPRGGVAAHVYKLRRLGTVSGEGAGCLHACEVYFDLIKYRLVSDCSVSSQRLKRAGINQEPFCVTLRCYLFQVPPHQSFRDDAACLTHNCTLPHGRQYSERLLQPRQDG